MTIDQLKYFVLCAENNSFTKTSKFYFVSQPAVSTAIKNLENELNCELFIRNNNELILTNFGKYFYTLATPVVTLYNNLPKQMNDYIMSQSVIKVGIPPMLGAFIFAPLFEKFNNLYPNLNIKMVELASKANQEAVIKDEIDVALTVIYNNEINPSLDYKKIDDTQLIFSVNKNHPLSNKKEISFRDLQNIPLILLKEDSLQYKIVIDFFKSYGIKPNIRLLSDQIATIKELLIYGNLGAFLFNQVIKENDDIVGIPIKENIHFDVVIAYKKNKTITKTTKRFINFILDNKKVN